MKKNAARDVFRKAAVREPCDMQICFSLGFSISLMHILHEYTFYLQTNPLHFHQEWLLCSKVEKIMLRKVRF